jgi:hypothetical protein
VSVRNVAGFGRGFIGEDAAGALGPLTSTACFARRVEAGDGEDFAAPCSLETDACVIEEDFDGCGDVSVSSAIGLSPATVGASRSKLASGPQVTSLAFGAEFGALTCAPCGWMSSHA